MFKRSTRLRELFLVEISRALTEVKDPGLTGFLTVTDLALAGDQKTARVYYSLLGSAVDRGMTQRALDRAAGFIRQRLYAKLRIKFVPKFEFVYDETPEKAGRVETMLAKLRDEAQESPAPEGDAENLEARLNALASRGSKRGRGSKSRPRPAGKRRPRPGGQARRPR